MIRTTPWTALVALLTSLLWTCPSHADLTVDAILAALAGGEFEEEFKAGCVEACGMEVGFDEACDAISGEPYGCINWTILRGLTVPRCSGKSKQIDLGVTLPASAGWEVSGEVSVGFNYLCAVANVQKCDVTQKQGATGNGGTGELGCATPALNGATCVARSRAAAENAFSPPTPTGAAA